MNLSRIFTYRLASNLTALTLALLGGCGGGGGGGDVAIDDFPRELETMLCQRGVTCGSATTQSICEDSVFLAENGGLLSTVAAVKRGTIVYDGGHARECLEALRANCANLREEPMPCNEIFSGAVAAGGACLSSSECAAGGRCVIPSGCSAACCVGACAAAPPTIPLGGACDIFDDRCVAGSYCSNAGTCAAELPAGAPCAGNGCASPAVCLRAPDGSSELCTVISNAEGAPCIPGANFGCGRLDEKCDATMRRCVKRAQPGGACQSSIDCVRFSNCVAGVCQMRPARGGACDFAAEVFCQGDLICPAGVCAAPVLDPVCPGAS